MSRLLLLQNFVCRLACVRVIIKNFSQSEVRSSFYFNENNSSFDIPHKNQKQMIGSGIVHPFVLEKINSLRELCNKYNVATLHIFGSATSGRFDERSDLDFLVTFGDIPAIDYADYFFDFMHDLENLYLRKIDLLTENSLTNPYLIRSIQQNKQLVYDRRNQEIFA